MLNTYQKMSSSDNSSEPNIAEVMVNGFISLNAELTNYREIDTIFSGTTCTTVLIQPEKLICASIGDSRAVLGVYENGLYKAINLSRDHKPTEKDEEERIISNDGVVRPYIEPETNKEIGPKRVWLKNSDIPGLAMTRSFGDEIAHTVGVSPNPEIKIRNFTGNERFLIIASDGIWEFIDSEECVHIIKNFYEDNKNIKDAAKCLVEEAFKRWRIEEETVDDITAIIIFFD